MKNGLKKSPRKELRLVAETIEEAGVCMITTVDHNGGLSSRPMFVQELDEEGSLWFFALSDSHVMNEIRRIPVVNITFTEGKEKFISALAIGYEAFDREKMQHLWEPSLKKWFHGGVDTKNLTFLKLDLQEVEYWGAPYSPVFRIIDFVKTITGDEPSHEIIYEKMDLTQAAD